MFARIIEGTLKPDTNIDNMKAKNVKSEVPRYEIFLKIPLDLPSRKLNQYKKTFFSNLLN